MTQSKKTNLFQFLTYTPSQKEVSLVVAKDSTEFEEFKDILNGENFIELKNLFEFSENISKSFLSLDNIHENKLKSVYDFAVQYPTGQVELFDSERMKSKVTTPDYQSQTVVFLATKDKLREIQEKGFNILPILGLTYQS